MQRSAKPLFTFCLSFPAWRSAPAAYASVRFVLASVLPLLMALPARAEPLSPGEWLVYLGRDYPLSAQAAVTDADATLTLLLMQGASRIDPTLADAWYWQADMLAALRRPVESRAALAEYIQLVPEDVVTHLRWIELSTESIQTAEERAAFWQRLLSLSTAMSRPDGPADAGFPREVRSDLNRRLAEYHWNRGEREQAALRAEAALAAFSMNFAAQQVLDQVNKVVPTPARQLEWSLTEMVVDPANALQASLIGDRLSAWGLSTDAEFWYAHADRLQDLAAGKASTGARPPASRPSAGTEPPPPEIRAMLDAFPRSVLDYPFNPAKYLSLTWNMPATELAPSEPWRCTVRLKNIGSFPITCGVGRMLEPELISSITMRGDQERSSGPTLRLSLHRKLRLLPGDLVERTWVLDVGSIRSSLVATPQMAQQVEVSGVLSPLRLELTGGGEAWVPSIGGLIAAPLQFRRSAFRATPDRVRDLARLSESAQTSDRIRGLEVLSMLLGEQQHLRAGRLRYGVLPIEAAAVQRAILARAADADWQVRARLAECLRWFVLDPEATRTATGLLADPHWLVRGLAVRLLADQHREKFLPVLEKIAQDDADEWVRRMARALIDRMRPASQPAGVPGE